jgi:Holliday junction resolvase-like predicted endonuclease
MIHSTPRITILHSLSQQSKQSMPTNSSKPQVRKNDGELVPFDAKKLSEALRRSGASEENIRIVDAQVAKVLYDGITTRKIYQLAYSILRKVSDHSAGRFRLKKALLKLGPSGYPFEHFVAKLFEAEGYTTQTGQIIEGKCVKHEVDVVAKKENKVVMVECKFHRSEGAKSDVKISLYVRSRFTDILNKRQELISNQNIHFQPMLITNTRFTEDAIQYGSCSGMKLISWDYPAGNALKEWIDRAKLFPITVLKSLTQKEIEYLLNQGIVLCSQIIQDTDSLVALNIPASRLKSLIKEAKALTE